jgi:hypothetical protein
MRAVVREMGGGGEGGGPAACNDGVAVAWRGLGFGV